jgi:2-polyprenyl-3-methyl-5-hydroxy-6-metoxy-1,4-benzoquinol methylase
MGNLIGSRSQPDCHCCGSTGDILLTGLQDRLFGSCGEWNMRKCSNDNCGLLWLDPMPLEAEIHKAYETFTTHVDNVAPRESALRRVLGAVKNGYLQARFGYSKGVGKPWHKLLAPLALLLPGGISGLDYLALFLAAPAPGGRLLEVGCGNGQTLATMREMGWDVEGVDVDPVSLNIARNRGLAVHQGRLMDLNFPADRFDAICMHHVVEHLHDPEGMIAECARIMKPGGKLVIITPNAQCLSLSLFKEHWYPLDPPRHIYLYNLKNLKTIFERAELKVTANLSISRAAKGYFILSSDLRQNNATNPYYNGTRVQKLTGLFYHLLQRMLIVVSPALGEELVVIGEKPAPE